MFDGEGNQLSRCLHGPQIDQVLAEETAVGEVRWALSDHQGSVRDVIGSQGNVLNHLTYDSYGQVTSESNPEIDFRFGYTGRERDEETGLYYYRARYFDPAPGTFVSADPMGFAAGDPNVYRYVFNSPTNYTDPSGELPILAVLAIGAAVGAGLSYLDQRAQMADGIICEVNWWDVGRGAVLGAGVAGVGLAAAPILAGGGQAALTLRAGLFASAGLGIYTSANDAVEHFRRDEYASGAFDTGLAVLSLFSAGTAASPPSSGPQFAFAGGGSYAQASASAAAAQGVASSVGGAIGIGGYADDIGGTIFQSSESGSLDELLEHVRQHNGSPPSGYKGNKTYSNTPGKGGQELPKADPSGAPITYKEYDIKPYQKGVNRGSERIVIGSDGKVYYTDDHYETFTEIP